MNTGRCLCLAICLPVIIFAAAPGVKACTGFAVYSGSRPLYGMNFDYPENREVAFEISDRGGTAVFRMLFREDGNWIPTVAMNDRGLFASMQYQCPMVENPDPPNPGEVYVWNVFETAMTLLSEVQQVRGVLGEVTVVHAAFPTLHLLVADTAGQAVIVEVGDEENVLTELTGDFIVMTNFRNADFPGQQPDSVSGVGALRFAIAHGLLEGFEGDEDPMDAMQVLNEARSRDETFVTRASMVFDPSESAVYICTGSDFEHVWRASFSDMTLREWHPDHGTGTACFTLDSLVREAELLEALRDREGQ